MGWKRQAVRYAWRASARRTRDACAADPEVLRREFRVDPDWRRTEAGGAARLDHRTTITMDRTHGPWAEIDPLAVNDGWRRPWAVTGFVVWGAVVGLQGWRGWRRGTGPLGALRSYDR